THAGDAEGQHHKRKQQRKAYPSRAGVLRRGLLRRRSSRRERGDIRLTHDKRPCYSAKQEKGPGRPGPSPFSVTVAYFSELLIEVNLVFRFVPRPLTTAIIASEMPAAIRPYSMAVAPDSSFTKRAIRFFIS